MADISKIKVNNNDYNIKDATARSNISTLTSGKVGWADYRTHDETVSNETVEKHYIYFYKQQSDAPSSASTAPSTYICRIDAADFVKDAVVSNVTYSNGVLTISFNTDAGKQDIELSIGDVFDLDNYYDKDDVNSLISGVEAGLVDVVDNLTTQDATKALSANQGYVLNTNKANKSELSITAVTGQSDKKNIQLKSGTSQEVLIAHQDISGKWDKPRDVTSFLYNNFGIDTIFEEGTFPTTEGNARFLTEAEQAALDTIDNNYLSSEHWWLHGLRVPMSCIAHGDNWTWTGVANIGEFGGLVVIDYTLHATQDLKYWFTASYNTIPTTSNLADVATSGSYNDLSNKPTIPDELADLTDDSTHRLVTDTEKATWNTKVVYGKLTSGSFYKGTLSGTTWSYKNTAETAAVDKIYVDVNVNPPKAYCWEGSGSNQGYKELSVTIASEITENGTSPVQSSAIYTALANKADKSTAVTNVSFDNSSNKIKKTINGSTSDVVTLATVATTGSYGDLTGTPTIDSSLSSTSTNAVQNKKVYEALADKVDKVTGKGLSENDFTTTLKNKLDGIAAGAEVNVNADWNATSGDAQILNKPTNVSSFTNDAGYQTATQVNTAIVAAVSYSYASETLSLIIPATPTT